MYNYKWYMDSVVALQVNSWSDPRPCPLQYFKLLGISFSVSSRIKYGAEEDVVFYLLHVEIFDDDCHHCLSRNVVKVGKGT